MNYERSPCVSRPLKPSAVLGRHQLPAYHTPHLSGIVKFILCKLHSWIDRFRGLEGCVGVALPRASELAPEEHQNLAEQSDACTQHTRESNLHLLSSRVRPVSAKMGCFAAVGPEDRDRCGYNIMLIIPTRRMTALYCSAAAQARACGWLEHLVVASCVRGYLAYIGAWCRGARGHARLEQLSRHLAGAPCPVFAHVTRLAQKSLVFVTFECFVRVLLLLQRSGDPRPKRAQLAAWYAPCAERLAPLNIRC